MAPGACRDKEARLAHRLADISCSLTARLLRGDQAEVGEGKGGVDPDGAAVDAVSSSIRFSHEPSGLGCTNEDPEPSVISHYPCRRDPGEITDTGRDGSREDLWDVLRISHSTSWLKPRTNQSSIHNPFIKILLLQIKYDCINSEIVLC